ncbi:DUF302 domain-containing protein [Algoriphagus halophilus]|uniref:Uncharacterized conserved protein, DUF302 family n=1 Tax=Algoriphagus halophilus TaxID=226505 RepID=A0A1N6DKM8_9BACT|nr:DUF302 domain-containing protein [Algoriphagus halophilus]SIN71328.1 Uncharacterized conserved protein, DUF302 family [Algoriphagus halophilus]
MNYYQSKQVEAKSIQEVREQIEEKLKNEGFGILTEIDIQATMKKKLDKSYPPFLILGACNPVFADKVLSIEPQIATLLPCNVVIRETEKNKYDVSLMDPSTAMSVVKNPEIEGFAVEVREKLMRALNGLS